MGANGTLPYKVGFYPLEMDVEMPISYPVNMYT